MSGHVAHLNWGYLVAPWGDPVVAGFTDNVQRVNATAERSKGYVARPEMSERALHRTIYAPRGDYESAREAATLSVWETAEDLEHFVYNTIHGRFVAQREQWFTPLGHPPHVIWPISAGHVPDLTEAHHALERLETKGAHADAYDFKWLKEQREAAA
ncbi:MAG: DUF3291 domain-containing protein [Pseudomonadota bacterium]